MRKILLILYLLFLTIYVKAQKNKPDTLYAWESKGSSVQYLTRYFFDPGFIRKDTLLTDTIYDHFKEREKLMGNFIISCNFILDIERNKFLINNKNVTKIDEKSGNNIQDTCPFDCYTQIIGDSIIYPCYNKSNDKTGYVCFNLRENKYKELQKNEQFKADNILSPDKGKGLKYNYQTNEIELNSKNGSISLGKYYMKVDISEWGHGLFPAQWIDNNYFITQKSNGEIVKVDLSGKITPVVNIHISREGAYKPFFHKDSNGDFFYFFVYYTKLRIFNKDHIKADIYKIDLKNKTYKKSLPYEYNFKIEISERKIIVYSNNEGIGEFINYSNYRCKEGFIAILQTSKNNNTINIWNEHIKAWWKYDTKSNIIILGWSNL